MATKRIAILGERESTIFKVVRIVLIGALTTGAFLLGLAIVVVAVTD